MRAIRGTEEVKGTRRRYLFVASSVLALAGSGCTTHGTTVGAPSGTAAASPRCSTLTINVASAIWRPIVAPSPVPQLSVGVGQRLHIKISGDCAAQVQLLLRGKTAALVNPMDLEGTHPGVSSLQISLPRCAVVPPTIPPCVGGDRDLGRLPVRVH